MGRTITADQRNAAVRSLGIETRDLVETRWPLHSIELTYLERDDLGCIVFDGDTPRTRTETIEVTPS